MQIGDRINLKSYDLLACAIADEGEFEVLCDNHANFIVVYVDHLEEKEGDYAVIKTWHQYAGEGASCDGYHGYLYALQDMINLAWIGSQSIEEEDPSNKEENNGPT
jgi:hypothetical protein